jgi:hypothetical protein
MFANEPQNQGVPMTAATFSHPATAPSRRASGQGAAAPVRLTRRGRAVVLLALVALVCCAFLLGRGADSAAAGTSTGTSTGTPASAASSVSGSVSGSAASVGSVGSVTTVRPGETLWTIAKRLDPGHDPRALVQRLRALNDLTTGAVQAGQQLRVPALG